MTINNQLALYKKRLRRKIAVIEAIEKREAEGKELLERVLGMVGIITRQELMGSTTYHTVRAFLGHTQEGSINAWREFAADAKMSRYKFPHKPNTFHAWQETEADDNTWVRTLFTDNHTYHYFVTFGHEAFADIVKDGLLAEMPKVKQ